MSLLTAVLLISASMVMAVAMAVTMRLLGHAGLFAAVRFALAALFGLFTLLGRILFPLVIVIVVFVVIVGPERVGRVWCDMLVVIGGIGQSMRVLALAFFVFQIDG